MIHINRLFSCKYMKHFPIELLYFLSISILGFIILNSLHPRTDHNPRNIDLFFTSVSAATVSSMSTVEMEVFSNAQLIVITFLMLIGGEVLISMVGLFIRSFEIRKTFNPGQNNHLMLAESIQFLGFVVLGYFLVFHILGITSVLLVTNLVSSTKNVLKEKGIKQFTFAIFTIVSTFANCGFIPTNENMIVFRKNSAFLLILIPQVLFGNTLFPSLLRGCLLFFAKFYNKSEAQNLLKETKEIRFNHLLPGLYSWLLVGTVMGFVLIQFILFSALEWNSAGLSGLNGFEKFVGVLFMSINSRHTGESIVDLSAVAPAMLVVFVVMMYLPPYTAFLLITVKKNNQQNSEEQREKSIQRLIDNSIFSPLSYLAIFIIIICITERKSLKDDPLNFTVLSITLEVVSAYGNVGFSLGYSCERQVKADPTCVHKWYGFAGKWTDNGKMILIAVMFFGRLKKYCMHGGKAWKLS